jgi:hypothetical protein
MRRPLRAGDVVHVRSAVEVLASLDAEGRLDGLPFMPEMTAHCGRMFRVRRRADVTCVEGHGLRKLRRTVFLEDLRCDGAAHDGCQRDCLTFWKEAWLRPAGVSAALADPLAERRALERLRALPTRLGDRYVCQSTALAAASRPLPRWDVRHLFTDLARGELTVGGLIAIAWRMLANGARRPLGLGDLDALAGDNGRAPKGSLGLARGDWVRIRSAGEIRRTLGPNSKNRGLSFEPEMTRHVGELRQVDFPVRRIILEETGAMASLTSTVALKDLTCQGLCARNCPRANTLYWREAWLERVAERQAAAE